MEMIVELINQNIIWAPYIILSLLLLAGLNLPVSEDLMLFLSATLAAKYPEQFWSFFICVFCGAYFSDLICYQLGHRLGPKLWNFHFFSKMVSKSKVEKIAHFYEKYGALTLIVGRFIPFGVRNGLFLTAGLGRMHFGRFALYDLLACSISTTIYFSLYYLYGQLVIEYVKKSNQVIFTLAVLFVVYWVWKRKKPPRFE